MTDVAVVGLGTHTFGRHGEDVSGLQLGARAARAALADAGLSWTDIDLAVGGSNEGKPDAMVSELGLTGLPFTSVRNGCATGGVALITAANAIRAGEAEIALVVGFDKHERGAFRVSASRYGLGDWYVSSGMMVTAQYFAMRTRRYLYEHDLDPAVLALVASQAFRQGAATPTAWRRQALSVDEIRDADPVVPPLTRFMLCSPSEGGTAMVLTRADLASRIADRPVMLQSVSMRTREFGSFEVFSSWLPPGDLESPSVKAAAQAFHRAGASPADVDVAQVQDTDAGSQVIHLAETGLVEHGSQYTMAQEDAFAPDGPLPVNTDGGCLANGEPVGASGLRQVHEVALQLQGRAAGRQVPGGPALGFTHVYGAPGLSACAVLST